MFSIFGDPEVMKFWSSPAIQNLAGAVKRQLREFAMKALLGFPSDLGNARWQRGQDFLQAFVEPRSVPEKLFANVELPRPVLRAIAA